MSQAHLYSVRGRSFLAVILLLTVGTGCSRAIRSGDASGYQHLVIENQSPDVIRVWFDGGFQEEILGDVRPLGSAKFWVWRGDVPHDLNQVYIRVVPMTTGLRSDEPSRQQAVSSELFRMADAANLVWKYTGRSLIAHAR